MKTNLAQQSCADNCSKFKAEQRNDSLMTAHLPELKNQYEFLTGDVVALINGDDDSLYEFSRVNIALNAKCYITKPKKAKMLCMWICEIRHATVAELHAKRRLVEAIL